MTTHTPLHLARNLGPKTAQELGEVGFATLEQCRHTGWEEVLRMWVACCPQRANLNAARALFGAIHETDWRNIPAAELPKIREIVTELKRLNS
jgi:hypothetical protein